MTDAEIAELLTMSHAFNEKFSEEERAKMLKDLPNLSEEKKYEILKAILEEEESLTKTAEERVKIISDYEETLSGILRDADREVKEFIEQAEQKTADAKLNQLENQLINI